MKNRTELFYFLQLLFFCCISESLYSQNTKLGVVFGGGDVTNSNGIAVDKNQNIFTVGTFRGTADFDPGAAVYNLTSVAGLGNDVFISKFDASGNFVWAKSIGGKLNDNVYSVAADANGNVYLTCVALDTLDVDPGVGVYNMYSPGKSLIIIKLNPAGDFLWAKKINGNRIQSQVQDRNMKIDPSGNVYILGLFQDSIDFDPSSLLQLRVAPIGGASIFLLKLDSAGNFLWVQSIDCTETPIGYSIALTKSGFIYITGSFNGTIDFDPGSGVDSVSANSSSRNLFICKFNAIGNFIWARSCGGISNNNSCLGFSVQSDLNENVYAFGHFSGTIDFDPGAGTYYLNGEKSQYDAFIVKLDSAGKFILAKSIGSLNQFESFQAGVVDDIGNIFITGEFEGLVDFDPGNGVHNVVSMGNRDAFILRLDTSANFLWLKVMGSKGLESGQKMSVDGYGNLYVTGPFYGADTMFINSGNIIANGGGGNKVFVAVCNAYGVGINEKPQPFQVSVYPVPTNGKFVIETAWETVNAEVSITSLSGQEVYVERFKHCSRFEINLEGLFGVYIGKITCGLGTAYFKVIVD